MGSQRNIECQNMSRIAEMGGGEPIHKWVRVEKSQVNTKTTASPKLATSNQKAGTLNTTI